jgi:hypothetical protein
MMLVAAIPQQRDDQRGQAGGAPIKPRRIWASSKSFMRREAADAGENPPAADRRNHRR